MLAMSWQPWLFFLTLDYFSRACFFGVLLVTILGPRNFSPNHNGHSRDEAESRPLQ
jgi:hypothetical protein